MLIQNKSAIIEITSERLLNNPIISRLPVPFTCKKILAFTLAEVLVVLLIIGVIASIVIPALISNTQDAEFKTAWKKTYASITQVTNLIKADNGGSLVGAFANTDDAITIYSKYLSTAKILPTSVQFCGNYWAKTMHYADGTDHNCTLAGGGLILNDGAVLAITIASPDCTLKCIITNMNSIVSNGSIPSSCSNMLVDVNGLKEPNTAGKDIFGIVVLPDRAAPYSKAILNSMDSSYKGYSNSLHYLSN